MEKKSLDLVLDIKVNVAVQLGSCELPMREVLALVPGTILQLAQKANEPVSLHVNQKLVARGEVVLVGDSFGIRVTEFVGRAK
ncbi:MAG: flagellar motor switch protein FliN [Opitutaceae bacterium]|jgi:flagellar motor switch protein FliN/FliY|nr:flagellar motor switch protein FliN [Opitutaceae bacterium]